MWVICILEQEFVSFMNKSHNSHKVLHFRVVAASFWGESTTKYWAGIKANLKLIKGRTSPPSSSIPPASFPAGFLSGLGVPPLHQPPGDGQPDQGRPLSAGLYHKYVRPAVAAGSSSSDLTLGLTSALSIHCLHLVTCPRWENQKKTCLVPPGVWDGVAIPASV